MTDDKIIEYIKEHPELKNRNTLIKYVQSDFTTAKWDLRDKKLLDNVSKAEIDELRNKKEEKKKKKKNFDIEEESVNNDL